MGTVGFREPIPPMVSPFTRGWGFVDEGIATGAAVSASHTASRAFYYPLYVPTGCYATRLWWANGQAVAGNIEAAIYYDGGYKPGGLLVASGSTAQSGTAQLQFAEIADTRLDPGRFWLMLVASSASGYGVRATVDHYAWDETLIFNQNSVTPGSPPDPATPIEPPVTASFWVFGFSTNTVT